MSAKLVGLFVGTAFGFVLAWAGVTDPGVIRSMLLLKEAHVFLLMGSAILVAGIGVRVLRIFKARAFVTRESIAWSPSQIESRHVTGSALFGLGWSIACTCPGPVAAMIGQGRLSGILVAVGLMSGIALKHRVDARSPARPSTEVPPAAGL